MADDDLPKSERENPRREFRHILLGLFNAALLSAGSFAAAIWKPAERTTLLSILGVLALIQIGAHFRFFMHVDLKKSHRDDLQLVLFTAVVVSIMVGGSLWILFSQHARMG